MTRKEMKATIPIKALESTVDAPLMNTTGGLGVGVEAPQVVHAGGEATAQVVHEGVGYWIVVEQVMVAVLGTALEVVFPGTIVIVDSVQAHPGVVVTTHSVATSQVSQ